MLRFLFSAIAVFGNALLSCCSRFLYCFGVSAGVTDSTDYAEWDESGMGQFESHWGTTNSGGFWGDIGVKSSADEKWEKTDMGWPIVPWGFRKLLLWIQARYRCA